METVLSSKGQAVIPKPIRDALGLLPGSKINIELVGDSARISAVRKDLTPEAAYGLLHYAGPPIEESEWEERIAQSMRDDHAGR